MKNYWQHIHHSLYDLFVSIGKDSGINSIKMKHGSSSHTLSKGNHLDSNEHLNNILAEYYINTQ